MSGQQGIGASRTAEAIDGDRGPRRRRRRSATQRSSRGKLRVAYFTLASVWGFLSGSIGLLAGLGARARPSLLDTPLAFSFFLAAISAIGGAIVASRAYREASRKLR